MGDIGRVPFHISKSAFDWLCNYDSTTDMTKEFLNGSIVETYETNHKLVLPPSSTSEEISNLITSFTRAYDYWNSECEESKLGSDSPMEANVLRNEFGKLLDLMDDWPGVLY